MIKVKMERVVRKLLNLAIVGVIVLLLASSCGDGGLLLLSGGGISGTGRFLGIITGFGSVFVNGVEIETTDETNILIDDVSANENALKVGMKVEIEAFDNVASLVTYKSEIIGPIEIGSINTADNSFSVLGQKVIVDNTTIYEGVSGFAALQVNNIVEVSGFADANADIQATFVELEDFSLQEFQIRGTVLDHNGSNKTFNINNILINYSNIQNPPAISDGSRVEVKGRLDANIFEATEIEIEDFSYSDGDEVEMEGVITSLTSQSDFVVNNQRVQTNSQTEYEHGTASNIAENIRVEIKGSVNSSSILVAEHVEFRFVKSKSIKIEGAVQSVDTENSTVSVFGITIHVDANTGLKDEVQELRPFTLADIQEGDFLDVGGFVDDEGNIVAVILERDEMPEQDEFELRGPVDSETPNTGITILRVSVDVSSADFESMSESSIDANTFFNTVDTGDIVEVKGSFSGGNFTASEVEIELLN
jgi:hypothetical protein